MTASALRRTGRFGRSLGNRAFVVLGLALFIAMTSTGVSFAAWSSQSTVAASTTAATTKIAIDGVDGLSVQYTRAKSVVATVTVSNSGTAPLKYSLSLPGATGVLAPRIDLKVWTRPEAGCKASQGSGVVGGTLAAPPPLPATGSPVASGADMVLCVMTTLTGTVAASSGLTIAPVFTVTGTVGAWTTSFGAAFTQSVVDKHAPTKPGQPAALNTTTTSTALVWAASTDDVGVTEYDVYRDGSLIGSSSSPAYVDTSLAAGKSYSYTVRALDAAGNRSVASVALRVAAPSSDPSLWYQVVNPNSGMCVDGFQELTANGTPLIIYPCKPAVMNNQAWRFAVNSDGTFTVVAGYGTAPVWSVASGSISTELWASGAAADQRWTLVPLGTPGTFQFVAGDGACLAVPGASTVSETRLAQGVCGANVGQVFTLVAVP